MKNIDFSKTYSYSKLSLFDKCPKQYHFNYLDPEIALIKKQLKKQRDYQTKGSAVHDAITLFHHLPIKKRTFSNLKNCLLRAWFSESSPFQEPPLGELGGFETLEHERRIYRDSLILLKNLLKMEKNNPAIFYLPTEKIKESFGDYQELIKPLIKEVLISGKFDRIDNLEKGHLKIIDYKTGGKNQDQSQLYFYKLLAELNFKKKVSLVSFYYLNHAKKEDFDVSGMNSAKIKNEILTKVKEINKTEKFEPKPNRLCSHCDFKEICPAHKSLSEIKERIKELKSISFVSSS